MDTKTIDSIFDDIALLPDEDRAFLLHRLETEFYPSDNDVVAYTTSGNPLTKTQYRQRVDEGIRQCKEGKFIDLEELIFVTSLPKPL